MNLNPHTPLKKQLINAQTIHGTIRPRTPRTVADGKTQVEDVTQQEGSSTLHNHIGFFIRKVEYAL